MDNTLEENIFFRIVGSSLPRNEKEAYIAECLVFDPLKDNELLSSDLKSAIGAVKPTMYSLSSREFSRDTFNSLIKKYQKIKLVTAEDLSISGKELQETLRRAPRLKIKV